MVKNHSDSERGNRLPLLNGLLFLISSKGSFIYMIPSRIVHTTAFGTPVVEIAQYVHHEGSITKLHLAPKKVNIVVPI